MVVCMRTPCVDPGGLKSEGSVCAEQTTQYKRENAQQLHYK